MADGSDWRVVEYRPDVRVNGERVPMVVTIPDAGLRLTHGDTCEDVPESNLATMIEHGWVEPSLSGLSADDAIEHIESAPARALQSLHDEESNGKARVTVLKAINKRMED